MSVRTACPQISRFRGITWRLVVSMHLAVLLTIAGPHASVATAGPAAPWVLGFSGQSNDRLLNDSRIWQLISADLHIAPSSDRMLAFVGPPAPVFASQKRYLWSISCQAHNCDYKGFFWIDAYTGASLAATSEFPSAGASNVTDRVLTLGSTTLTPSSIPGSAMEALREWITTNDLQFTAAHFITRDGSLAQLDPALYRPRPQFVPPPGGPSFDCNKAKAAIDLDICRDPTLAKLDLRLDALYKQLAHSLTTEDQIAQLKSLQRTWLQRRDRNCRATQQRRRCLKGAYREQYDRLGNWMPPR